MDEFDGAWGSVSLPSTDLRLVVSHDSRCVIGDERQRYISLPLDTLKLIINIVPITPIHKFATFFYLENVV